MDDPLISRDIFRGGVADGRTGTGKRVKSSPKRKGAGWSGMSAETLVSASGMYARLVPFAGTKRDSPCQDAGGWPGDEPGGTGREGASVDDSRKLIRDVSFRRRDRREYRVEPDYRRGFSTYRTQSALVTLRPGELRPFSKNRESSREDELNYSVIYRKREKERNVTRFPLVRRDERAGLSILLES